jgi:AcrR family transcriptional regulator
VEKKRGRYHHGDLRRALLDAALEVLSAEGAAALTLREVARRAGVTHAAPYRHFTDKQALLATVAEEGFRMLAAEMTRGAAPHASDPRRALEAIGAAYVRFATSQRAHFQVMFGKDIDWTREECGLEETADLRREDVRVAGAGAERGTEAPLGEAEPVVGRGVEVSHPELPRAVDCRECVGLRHLAVQVPELRASQRERAQIQISASEWPLLHGHADAEHMMFRGWQAAQREWSPQSAPREGSRVRADPPAIRRSSPMSSRTRSSAGRCLRGRSCRPSRCSASVSVSAVPSSARR